MSLPIRQRPLAVGLTAAGHGAGSALSVIPIRSVIDSAGYEAAFFWFGVVQGGIVFILAWLLRAPDPGEIPPPPPRRRSRKQLAQLHTFASFDYACVLATLCHVASWCRRQGLIATAQIADFDRQGL